MIRRSVLRNHVLRNLLGQGLSLRQPPPERVDKALIAFTALDLSGRLRRIRQWRGSGQPTRTERPLFFFEDGRVAFKPLDLSRQPVEPTPQRSLHPLGII